MVNSVWWGVVPVAAVCVLGGLSVGVQGVAVADANDGTGAVLRFARQYGNDMVLQAGGKGATVWGYAPPGDTVSVTVTKDRHPVINSAVQALVGPAGTWNAVLPPQPPTKDAAPHTVTAQSSSSGDAATLTGVVFGDVWVCSGQSNMDHPMTSIINATEEINAANKFHDTVRLMMVKHVVSTEPTVELAEIPELATSWCKTSNITVSNFSATCFLTGSILQQHLGYPVGLIDSSWAGVGITPLTSFASCDRCGVDANIGCAENKNVPQNATSVYNTMIAPLHTTTITGVLWWQGEASGAGCPQQQTNKTTATYYCMWQSMIQDWRSRWALHSNTIAELPFGFVQLEPTANPSVRWDETAHRISTPNVCLPRVFMAVALDYGDTVAGVHTRYKRSIAERLALSARGVAYSESVYFSGPVAAEVSTSSTDGTAIVTFNSSGVGGVDLRGPGGFSVCAVKNVALCYEWANDALFVDATATIGTSPLNNEVVLTLSPADRQKIASLGGVGLVRYEWAALPCNWPTLEDCAIYSIEGGLPAPPFMLAVSGAAAQPPPCIPPQK